MPERKNVKNKCWSTFAQVLAALSFSLLAFNLGFIFGMLTLVIGALRKDDGPIRLSESEASWFGSLIFFVQPFGSVLSVILQEFLGRKKSLILINVPKVVAWIILYFSTSVEHLFISVVLLGLTIGFIEAPLLSYIGEISEPRLRGVLSTFGVFFYNMGAMVISFIGVWLPWRHAALCSIIGPVVTFIFISLMPDSPAWLVTKGRVAEAEKAYQWLRGWVSPEAVKEELGALVEYVRNSQKNKEYSQVPMKEGVKAPQKTSASGWWRPLLEPEVIFAFQIVFIYFIIAAGASLFGLRPFFIEILDTIGVPLKPHVIVAICGSLQMAGALSMALGIKYLGKRGMTFLSLLLCLICCIGLAVYFHFDGQRAWIPVALFSLSYFAGALGICGIPWLLVIELFPLRARGLGGGVSTAFAYLLMFLVTKTFYNLTNLISLSGTCLFYGVIGLLGFIYLYIQMPETEGFKLEEIESRLQSRRSSSRRSGKNGIQIVEFRNEETDKENMMHGDLESQQGK